MQKARNLTPVGEQVDDDICVALLSLHRYHTFTRFLQTNLLQHVWLICVALRIRFTRDHGLWVPSTAESGSVHQTRRATTDILVCRCASVEELTNTPVFGSSQRHNQDTSTHLQGKISLTDVCIIKGRVTLLPVPPLPVPKMTPELAGLLASSLSYDPLFLTTTRLRKLHTE